MDDFDKLLRKHRRDKAGRKRKRKRPPPAAAAAAATSATAAVDGTVAPNLRPSVAAAAAASGGDGGGGGGATPPGAALAAAAYSAPFSGARFEAHQSQLSALDRAWTQPYTFTKDWHTRHVAYWRHHLAPFVGRRCDYLEIGCFEGLSTVWMLTHVLTHVESTLTVCDTFCGVQGQDDVAETTHVTSQTRLRFDSNIARTGARRALRLFPKMSQDMFAEMLSRANTPMDESVSSSSSCSSASSSSITSTTGQRPGFDLIYIDGSHVARDVLLDACCAFALLRPGGIMMFDDYEWNLLPEDYNCPGLGIDVFRSCFGPHMEVVHCGYQFFCRKVSHAPLARGPISAAAVVAKAKAAAGSGDGAGAPPANVPLNISSAWVACLESRAGSPCAVLQLGALGPGQEHWLGALSNVTVTRFADGDPGRDVTVPNSNSGNGDISSNGGGGSAGRTDADTALSRALRASNGVPTHDVLVVGDVGGDAATALRALVIAWRLLRNGGTVLASKPAGRAAQLALDGMCDCFEPHVRSEARKDSTVLHKHAGAQVTGLQKNV